MNNMRDEDRFIGSIIERLRGKRVSSYEAKSIFSEFLRCMDYDDAHHVIEMIYNEIHERPDDRMRERYLRERGRQEELSSRFQEMHGQRLRERRIEFQEERRIRIEFQEELNSIEGYLEDRRKNSELRAYPPNDEIQQMKNELRSFLTEKEEKEFLSEDEMKI